MTHDDVVRLRVPANWHRPPLYVPHPDSVLHIERCVWCLTPLDQLVPIKFRNCPRCGKFGATAEPLIFRIMYVEECESRKEKKNDRDRSDR